MGTIFYTKAGGKDFCPFTSGKFWLGFSTTFDLGARFFCRITDFDETNIYN